MLQSCRSHAGERSLSGMVARAAHSIRQCCCAERPSAIHVNPSTLPVGSAPQGYHDRGYWSARLSRPIGRPKISGGSSSISKCRCSPAFPPFLVPEDPTGADISSLKCGIVGAAPLPERVCLDFKSNTGVPMIEGRTDQSRVRECAGNIGWWGSRHHRSPPAVLRTSRLLTWTREVYRFVTARPAGRHSRDQGAVRLSWILIRHSQSVGLDSSGSDSTAGS